LTDSDIRYCFGSDGNPSNDSSAVGGSLVTGTNISDTVLDNLHVNPTIQSTEQTYIGIAGRYNNHGSHSWLNAKFQNRCGGITPSSAGLPTLSSTQGDTGVVWIAYKHSGVWITRQITLAGVVPVLADATMDAGSDWLMIYGTGSVPLGDVSLVVAGQTCGVMYGSAGGARSYCASTLYQIAVATAQNAAISATNRKVSPGSLSGVGSWSNATKWTGHDTTVAIPGTDLDAGDSISYAVSLRIPGGLPRPPGGLIQCDFDLIGESSA
jgi:hypothetical protein